MPPAVSSAYDISRLTSSASSDSISSSSRAAVSGGRSAIRSAASSGDISSRTSAARSASRCSRISTWSSSGSSSSTSASRSSFMAATTAERRSGGQVVDDTRRIRRLHVGEGGDQVGRALLLVAPGEPLDVAPLRDVGLAAPTEARAGFLYGDPGQHPVAVAGLLHADVEDGSGHVAAGDGDRRVEHLADDEGLGRPLLEAAHVEQAGGVHLPAVDVRDPGHRDEDPSSPEHLGDQAQHPGLAHLGPHRGNDVTHLADLVPLGVEDRQADQAGGVDTRGGVAHVTSSALGGHPSSV